MGEDKEQTGALGGVKNALSSFRGLFGKKVQKVEVSPKVEEAKVAPEPAPVVAAHQPPAQPEAVKPPPPPAEVPQPAPEVKSEATQPAPEVKGEGTQGAASTPSPGPVVSREDFDGRMKMLVERLYEDESLRSDLTDDEAGPLLDWAMNDLMERLEKVYQTATTTKELEEGLESQYAQTRSLIMVKKSMDSPAN